MPLSSIILVPLALVCVLALATYLLPVFLLAFILSQQDLRKKYNAEWALVTGASSGIGKALVHKLASQGINVCMVALNDSTLAEAVAHFRKTFPSLSFVPIGVDLSTDADSYMGTILDKTKDLPIGIVMNNAGYLSLGFFIRKPIEAHLRNLECNATAALRISHHFLQRFAMEKRKGCITFTSSAVHFMPSPFAIMYGASKALLSHFATSLAIEAADHNVDVLCVHPSYTSTNLYAETPKLGVLALLEKMAATPDDVANVMFRAVGRVVVRDTGVYAFITKLIPQVIDIGLLTSIMIPFRTSLDEYKRFSKAD